ncbi:MAG TPA: diguanylate cyclase [Gammaproteobacteria bacterium]|nr:diguanylate cyclase [Gammaproteobacteria bacterium]
MLTDSTIIHFDALRADYLQKLAEQTAELRRQMQHLEADVAVDHTTIAPAIAQLHKLADSCATFALPTIGENARRGEHLLTEILDGHLEWNDSTQQVLNDALLALTEAVSAAQQETGADNAQALAADSTEPCRVLLYTRDHSLDDAATVLMQFGYQVEQLRDLALLDKQITDYQPAILIMPFSPAVEKQLANLPFLPPIVFVARQQDFATRLAALRAGGRALLAESPDGDELTAVLAEICPPPAGSQDASNTDYDIAILDPDPELGRYYGFILQRAGMRPTIVQQPQELLDHLKVATCNAIISAVQLPGCDGHELAATLHQIPASRDVPVILLADKDTSLTEQDIDTLHTSGNDYLKYPAKAEQLVPIVANHARIHRTQSALSQRDSLTGVLNYHALLKALEREILRARRQQTALSIGLLSMDHFKRVNDGFGYAAGNSAIKSLAHLMTQRLRRSDVVGRLEGDVFLVIFPATDNDAARQVLDVIRTNFGNLQHHGLQGDFTINLSGGVVQLQAGETADALLARADTALYQAKRAGRNLIK